MAQPDPRHSQCCVISLKSKVIDNLEGRKVDRNISGVLL